MLVPLKKGHPVSYGLLLSPTMDQQVASSAMENPCRGSMFFKVEEAYRIQRETKLIRMATDRQLTTEEADDLEFAAPVYAIHILKELHAEEAIEPLLSQFDNIDDDWIQSELTSFYVAIGPVAIPAIKAYLVDPSHSNEYTTSIYSDRTYVPSTSSSFTTTKTVNKGDSKKKTKNKMAKVSRKKNRRK